MVLHPIGSSLIRSCSSISQHGNQTHTCIIYDMISITHQTIHSEYFDYVVVILRVNWHLLNQQEIKRVVDTMA
jgi:hypothetical protein